MFSTANTFTLTLPSSEQIVFGVDDSSANWVGLVGQNGVTSNVELRESRSPVARADGETIGNSYWGSRSIVIDIFIPSTDPTVRADAIKKLQKCTTMIRTPGTLSWTEQDTAATLKTVPVYLQNFPTINHNAGPAKNYQITLTAAQPHIDTGGTASTIVDGARSTNHTAANGGDWDAYPVIVLKGPFTASEVAPASVTNSTTGQTIKITSSITSAQRVEIETRPDRKQVWLKDSTTQTNFYDKITLDSDFIRLKPGNNTINYTAPSGTSSSTVSLTWRGAWM